MQLLYCRIPPSGARVVDLVEHSRPSDAPPVPLRLKNPMAVVLHAGRAFVTENAPASTVAICNPATGTVERRFGGEGRGEQHDHTASNRDQPPQ